MRSALLTSLALLLALPALRADEGMWTFDNLPVKRMQAKYGFAPDQAWLDHVRLSALRFPGGSGSFISADGLVLTNHHVGRSWIQAVSDAQHDYVKNGFVASSREQEIKVPGLELFTLMAMENVTARVNGAVKPGTPDGAALKVRQAELGRIQKELQDRTGLTFEAVTLYQGGEYWMYGYKKHTDVRLVAAPEQQIAFFGGDPDNFTYPRHNLDFSLFRVYEQGQPYHPPHHLAWTRTGLKAGDLTFVTGHPGRTARLETLAQMRFSRDFDLPERIRGLERQREALLAYASTSPEAARQVNAQIFGLENSIKARTGYLNGLRDREAMARIEAAEAALKARVAADATIQAKVGESWTKIEQALERQKALHREATYVGTANSTLLAQALTLVRLAEEASKPGDQRLPEYAEAQLKALRARLGVQRPFYPEQEIALFTFGLKEAQRELGSDHPFVKAMLEGRRPEAAARAAVEGSKLADAAVRKALVEGGRKAIDASLDPMILLAKRLDPLNREVRKRQEAEVSSVITEHGGRIARARFEAYGKADYPDATFTLRLTYGPVEGYPANGTKIQPFTTFHGLFDRAIGQGPEAEHGAWALPSRWLERKDRLDLATPFDFCHAVDIIGGNSGSPVVDRKGELVGLIFDGNIESLAGDYFYDGRVNRGLSVDARAILEALEKVMDAHALVEEIRGK